MFFFKKTAIPGLFFLYFRLCNTFDSIQMFKIKFADDWIWTAVLQATALPTEPQQLPIHMFVSLNVKFEIFFGAFLLEM